MAKKRKSSIILTGKQAKLVDATLEGKDPITAASEADYASPARNGEGRVKAVAVQEALRAARSELSSAAQISRADVIDGIMDAIRIARMNADPTAMIKGWSEVGKILGHYAPEVKKVELSVGQQRLQSKYEAMTDEELLEIAEGRVTVLNGESTRVN
ncbi:MAG TPA: hypothetical protein PLP92_03240 [Rhodocyclaceae bacterium]|nr:hypothetical protein [Rhodocyclaceae bacterium]